MNNFIRFRLLSIVIILVCVIQGWWLMAFAIALVHAWNFAYPLEIIVAGAIYDSLFGMIDGTGIRGYAGIIAMTCAFLIITVLKKIIR